MGWERLHVSGPWRSLPRGRAIEDAEQSEGFDETAAGTTRPQFFFLASARKKGARAKGERLINQDENLSGKTPGPDAGRDQGRGLNYSQSKGALWESKVAWMDEKSLLGFKVPSMSRYGSSAEQ
jgi:hypothetical protein